MITISGFCDTWKTIHQKRACYDGYIYIWFPHKFIYPRNKKLGFHIPHVRILGCNNCGNTLCGAIQCHKENQDGLCHCYYAERVVDSFAHQTQSEYYGGIWYVFIEFTVLEHFSAPSQTEKSTLTQAHTSWCVSPLFVWWHQTIFFHNYGTQQTHHWIFGATQHSVCYVN